MGGKAKLLMLGTQSPFGLGLAAGFKVLNQLSLVFNRGRIACWVQVEHSILFSVSNDDRNVLYIL
jgi:hypothetical protein